PVGCEQVDRSGIASEREPCNARAALALIGVEAHDARTVGRPDRILEFIDADPRIRAHLAQVTAVRSHCPYRGSPTAIADESDMRAIGSKARLRLERHAAQNATGRSG